MTGTPVRQEFQNELGRALRLIRVIPEGPRGRHALEAEPLERRLDLVRGVGPRTRERLAQSGYRTLLDLARHPRFGRAATRISAALAKRDARALLAAGARDIELLPLFGRDEVAVVDIETTGLAQTLPVFLVGVALWSAGRWEIRQYFARGFEEEAAVLKQVSLELEGRAVCVSYNGKAFDEPFVRARFRLYGLPPVTFALHVDLLHTCRRRYGAHFPDCRLTTVAGGLLGLVREGDVPGDQVPDLYYRYVRDGDEAAIAPVIEHNAADLTALAWLLDALDPRALAGGRGAAREEDPGGEESVSC
ncbi:MAG: ribonuclease H-like domain-containing protein [Clostridia bacterium]